MPDQRSAQKTTDRFGVFFLLSWLHVLWLTYSYYSRGVNDLDSNLGSIFHLAAWPLYSGLYLLPAFISVFLMDQWFPRRTALIAVVGVLMTTFILLLLHTDRLIYDLYAFHINGFVVNLVVTPGGLSSLGSSTAGFISVFLVASAVVLLQTGFILLNLWLNRRSRTLRISGWRIATCLVGLFLIQGSVYGISDVNNFGPVLDSSKVYPFFQRVRFRSLAAQFGFEHSRRTELSTQINTSTLNYPLTKMDFNQVAAPPNIIILVAESLRWDQLNPETMPNTWQISQQGIRFNRHYSSGNGTREGLFGMFYGLYGSYWENFMHAGRSPLLMDRLQELHYKLDVRTSAMFTYPEFDRTLFANVPHEAMHTADGNLPPWQRDEHNVDELLNFLKSRDSARPFMEFFFLESTHADYSFPTHQLITTEYLDTVDYTKLARATLATSISPLYNRYRNAAHWIDAQLGRIYQQLKSDDLLGNTIVIITGDHGEEFMEHGAWGHNSTFVEEQTHVPFVMLLPGQETAVVNSITSHVDIATTLLQILGAPPEARASYSLGQNLLMPEPRQYIVMSDWHSIAVMTEDMKYRIPYLNAGADYWEPTDAADQVLAPEAASLLTKSHQQLLLEAMRNCSLFSTRSSAK